MEQVQISSVNGRTCTDSFGRELVRIGNMSVRAGDVVWTDGKCIYGHIMQDSPAKLHTFIPNSEWGHIPVLTSSQFYIYSHITGMPLKRINLISSENIQINDFVNNGDVMYIAIGKKEARYRSNGKWYKVTPEYYTPVCNWKYDFIDVQVSHNGDLLILYKDGLYTNGSLTTKATTDSQIATKIRTDGMAYAKNINHSKKAKPSSYGCYVSERDGRICDDDELLLVGGNTSLFRTLIYWDIIDDDEIATAALNLDYTAIPILEGSSCRFVYVHAVAYNNNSNFAYFDEFKKSGGDRVVDVYQGKAIIAEYNGKRIPAVIMTNGGAKIAWPFDTLDGYTDALLYFSELTKEIAGDTAFYCYYTATIDSSEDFIDSYPLNEGYSVSRKLERDSKWVYTAFYNGEFLYQTKYDTIRRSAYGYKCKKQDTHLLLNGITLHTIQAGKYKKYFTCSNKRLAYVENLKPYVTQIKKLIQELSNA